MAPAKTKQASRESPDNSSDIADGSCPEPTTDTCSRSNTAKASEDNHPIHAGVRNRNNSNHSGLPFAPIVSRANPAQAATSSDATATPLVSTPPPPKSGIQNLARAQQAALSESSASVDPATPIVTSKTIVGTKIITSTSLFTTVIPVTSFPSVGSSGSSGSSGSNLGTPIAAFIGGTVAIVVVGVILAIPLFLQKCKQSPPGRTTSSIASSEAYSDYTINMDSQEKHEACQGMVGGLNQATSPTMMNASESSRVKRVPVPSMTDISMDPFSDDATLGSFVDFTLTSVDTFEDLKLAEAGRISNSSSFFQDEYLEVKLLQPEGQ